MGWISSTIKQSEVIMAAFQGRSANLRQRFLQNDIDELLDYKVIFEGTLTSSAVYP